jgi:hypothetical protein
MTDLFAVLRVPARPWLDPEPLTDAYVRLSEALHQQPASHGRLVLLNRAFQVLNDPATRVEHLLAVTGGGSNTGEITPRVGDLFGQVASCLQEADRLLGEASVQAPALLRALHIQRVGALQADLDDLANKLYSQRAERLEELRRLDEVWERDPAKARRALAQLALELTFLQKWQGQIRERRLRMDEVVS